MSMRPCRSSRRPMSRAEYPRAILREICSRSSTFNSGNLLTAPLPIARRIRRILAGCRYDGLNPSWLSLRPEAVNRSHIERIHDAIVASPSPVKSYLQMSLLEALYRLLSGQAHNVSIIVHSPPSGFLLPDFVSSDALKDALSCIGLE